MTDRSTHIHICFSRGWLVAGTASMLGLVFGILYVWSVIKSGIPDAWEWTHADKALPYSVMAVTFSVIMMPAGMLQDRYGPKPVIMLGGFLAGLGCVAAGIGGSALAAHGAGFGFLTGAGVGFGYSALTPAAIKWFPEEKTGLVAGIVVAGSGL
ncbi:MAG: MFS transporter, partial [Desulfobacterales bacterium]|nr:MFS transporter [Desulfobacterales bacterium]